MKCEDSEMPQRSSKPKKKRPTDVNELARSIVAIATGETDDGEATEEPTPESIAHAAAVALGRLGGLKGGKARAATLSARRRSTIAKNAATVRWRSKKKGAGEP
jgi:hypothetical protein